MPTRWEPSPKPADADAFRATWAEVETLWTQTVARARELPPDAVHDRVRGEWSFVQTLRHLVFVTDAWVSRAVLGDPAPYHPLGLPPTGMTKPSVPGDLEARPSLDLVLGLRAERQAIVRGVLATLTDEQLDESVRVRGPGHPRAGVFPVRRSLTAVVHEEWRHRLYAERDLTALLDSR